MTARVCVRHRSPLVGWQQRKLCERRRAEIREHRRRGATLDGLARRYGVSINAIWRVCGPVPAAPSLADRVAAVRTLTRDAGP